MNVDSSENVWISLTVCEAEGRDLTLLLKLRTMLWSTGSSEDDKSTWNIACVKKETERRCDNQTNYDDSGFSFAFTVVFGLLLRAMNVVDLDQLLGG